MPSTPLPSIVPWTEVQRRLELVFPEGSANRNNLTRVNAAKTVFVMLYVGATGDGVMVSPKHVYSMTDKQALLTSSAQRIDYHLEASVSKYEPNGKPWFAGGSRESIRKYALKGLREVGAASADATVTTNANAPRYSLTPDFAKLFLPELESTELSAAIARWRKKNLSPEALTRALVVASANSADAHVSVRLPGLGGATRPLEPGPTRPIAKGFLEIFVPRFFTRPQLIFLSQSGEKALFSDHQFAQKLGLNIDASKVLPDLVLAEIEPRLLLVFVEFVATNGPISAGRKSELQELAASTKLPASNIAFISAFLERSGAPFKAHFSELAWNSFAWCAAEPERLVALFDQRNPPDLKLDGLLRIMEPPVEE